MLDPATLEDAKAALSKTIAEEAERDGIQKPISTRPAGLTFDMLAFLKDVNHGRASPLLLDFEDISKCAGKVVALDTETNGLAYWQNHITDVGLWCPQAGVYGCIPTPDERSRQRVRDLLLGWPPSTTVCLHNAKFDMHMLGIDPIEAGWKIMDTTILVHLMDSRDRKALGPASAKYLGENCKAEYVAWGSESGRRKKLMIWQWPESIRAEYCISDCRLTYLLAQKLVPEIKARGQWPLFTQLSRYLGRVWQIERHGMALDQIFVDRAIKKLTENVQIIEEDLYQACGQRFNWKSSAQLSKALYADLGIVKPTAELDGLSATTKFKVRYTETATSAYLLMEKAHHPLGGTILDLREADKLKKYLEMWKGLVDQDSLIHTGFNITGTRTGRLSSSKPNIQNLPGLERTRETQSSYSGKSGYSREDCYNLRTAFVPRPGNVFTAVDYKQQEIRCFGVQSGDENMLAALRTGADIHASIAAKIWKYAPDDPKAKVYRELVIACSRKIRSIAGNLRAGSLWQSAARGCGNTVEWFRDFSHAQIGCVLGCCSMQHNTAEAL